MNKPGCYAEGGEVDEDQMLLDHAALECMHAIENKDKTAFLDAFHVLVAHTISGMEANESEGE